MKRKFKNNTKPKAKRGVSICSGCIEEFKYTELTKVSILDKLGMQYSTVFCEKCVKEENFPPSENIEIKGKLTETKKTKKNNPKTHLTFGSSKTICGMNLKSVNHTMNVDECTCKRCLKSKNEKINSNK